MKLFIYDYVYYCVRGIFLFIRNVSILEKVNRQTFICGEREREREGEREREREGGREGGRERGIGIGIAGERQREGERDRQREYQFESRRCSRNHTFWNVLEKWQLATFLLQNSEGKGLIKYRRGLHDFQGIFFLYLIPLHKVSVRVDLLSTFYNFY